MAGSSNYKGDLEVSIEPSRDLAALVRQGGVTVHVCAPQRNVAVDVIVRKVGGSITATGLSLASLDAENPGLTSLSVRYTPFGKAMEVACRAVSEALGDSDPTRGLERIVWPRRGQTVGGQDHLESLGKVYAAVVESGSRSPSGDIAEAWGLPRHTVASRIALARTHGFIAKGQPASRNVRLFA